MEVIGNRQRLITAAATLLAERGTDVSTRAICEAAGVTAPTLYHYFGDRAGLLDAVVTHGFTEYLARKRDLEPSGNPIDDLRRGWDDHIDWGTGHPAFYALMYGQVRPGHHAPAADEAEALLVQKLESAAQLGLLRVPATTAVGMIMSANVGLTLQLISRPERGEDGTLSRRVREAIFAAILDLDSASANPVSRAAVALQAALAASPPVAIGLAERPLLDSWLDRLAAESGASPQ